MKLFINDIPVYILDGRKVNMGRVYGVIVREFETIIPDSLIDDVLIMDASFEQLDDLLKLMTYRKLKKVHSIVISTTQKRALIDYLKEKFKLVYAGGGIVVNKDEKLLLIYRRGKWDLPKGKMDKNEHIKKCALREVEEETGVTVKLGKKINAVWHTYMSSGKYILKKTNWYSMECVDDKNMKPQLEEGIQEVKWMLLPDVRNVMKSSYRSIRYVVQEYIKMIESDI